MFLATWFSKFDLTGQASGGKVFVKGLRLEATEEEIEAWFQVLTHVVIKILLKIEC